MKNKLNEGISKLSDDEFEEARQDFFACVRVGEMTATEAICSEIQYIMLRRLATLMPDDPVIAMCIRALDGSMEDSIEIADAIFTNARKASP